MDQHQPRPRARTILVATVSFTVAVMIADSIWALYSLIVIAIGEAAQLKNGITPFMLLGPCLAIVSFVAAYRWGWDYFNSMKLQPGVVADGSRLHIRPLRQR